LSSISRHRGTASGIPFLDIILGVDVMFFRKHLSHPDWYRIDNPAGTDLEDVNAESHNPALGIINMKIARTHELSLKVCTVEMMLVGATLYLSVYQSRREDTHYLALPEGVELPKKIHAQVLRYVEEEIKRRFD
jgi:hypothetical protein